MKSYKFIFDGKTYELREDNFSYLLNDEDNPVSGIEQKDILELLSNQVEVDFDFEYYDKPCEKCQGNKVKQTKYFKFIEVHFNIYTKNGNYVLSNLSKEYEKTTYNKLLKEGKVDNSYLASVTVCDSCGDYTIAIEQCDV